LHFRPVLPLCDSEATSFQLRDPWAALFQDSYSSFSPQPSPASRLGRKTFKFFDRDRRALHCAGQHLVCWPSGARGGLAPLLSVARSEFFGRQVVQTAMGPVAIEVLPPHFNDLAGFRQSEEYVLVQAFVPVAGY
jgi:hypothetical protein